MRKIQFPSNGEDKDAIMANLKAMKKQDLNWQSGKVFSYIYGTDESVMEMAQEAYKLYLTENGLDPSSFPSLLKLETEVISMVAGLLNGGQEATGNCTSGGTESVILAVKTARDFARATRPEVTNPEIIVPVTAHPCFNKAAHYLGVSIKMIPVDPVTYRADVKAMEAAITDQTIMMVGSAPSYTHGVIDPIDELAPMAKSRGILFHVDSCVGGMYLPFAKMLGYDIPPFDFSVDGVTSISCDLHKYGYVPKGCSSIIYKDKELRQYQLFASALWPGYALVNPTVLSSKTGGPMAAAWAMFHHLGIEGYKKMTKACQEATIQLTQGINAIPELKVLGEPKMSLFTFTTTTDALNVFELSEALSKKGWFVQAQLETPASPASLHISMTDHNTPHVPALLEDLKTCIAELTSGKENKSKEMLMGLDSSMIQLMLADFNPDMLDMLETFLGTNESGMPEDMVMINNLLNGLSADQREMLLKAFVNRMFTSPK